MKKLLVCAFLVVTLGSLSFTTRFGLDGYEIFLNNKSVLKQYINQPLNLRVLNLDQAKESDQLRIVYKHCRLDNGTGTGRGLALKDQSGTILQQWSFSNEGQMTILVKELRLAEKKSGKNKLSLYYTARELEKGEMLAMISLK